MTKRNHRALPALLALMLLLAVFQSPAAQRKSPFDNPNEIIRDDIEETPWKEGESDLPPYPKEENLLEFQVDEPASRFRYFVDAASLSVGQDDTLVRYTLVIRSRNGHDNVMYEAMNCTQRQYKTFAYGTRGKKFKMMRKPRWRAIMDTRNNRYRRDLWEFYLCDFDTRKTLTREEILAAFRNQREDRKDRGFFR
ncbi:MAG TPA: hypothetical protein ENK50_11530 [Sedimenticola sp.]|nr:hypothetical protein [Sedimenticola sp.]